MRKYETEFKLEVVQSFLAGEGGAKLLARRWSIPEEKVRTWVREENGRLRAEVAYLKKLQALIRSKRSAAPTSRV